MIYSQVSKNKSGNEILRKTTPDINSEQASASGMLASSDLHHRGCDTDSAALERLSQLLTSSKDCSEVSVKNDLITLLDDQQMVIPSGINSGMIRENYSIAFYSVEIIPRIHATCYLKSFF